jgi:hypothetical protein
MVQDGRALDLQQQFDAGGIAKVRSNLISGLVLIGFIKENRHAH